jgi:hypothetical protein
MTRGSLVRARDMRNVAVWKREIVGKCLLTQVEKHTANEGHEDGGLKIQTARPPEMRLVKVGRVGLSVPPSGAPTT